MRFHRCFTAEDKKPTMGADAWLMANAGALVKDHCSQIVSASREEIYRVPSSFLFPVNRRMPPAGALWRQWKTPGRRRAALAQGVRSRLASNTAASSRRPWYVARSNALSVAFFNAYLKSRGLPTLNRRLPA